MVKTADQVAQLAYENGLKVSDGVAASLQGDADIPLFGTVTTATSGRSPEFRGNGTSVVEFAEEVAAKLNGEVLLPTPAVGHIRNYDEPVEDYLERRAKADSGEYRGMPGVSLGVAVRMELLPTPNTMDMLPARTPEQKAANKGKGGYSNVRETVVNDLLPTPVVDDSKNTGHNPNRTYNSLVRETYIIGEQPTTTWGKFEPAIRRWEEVIGRQAPAPTKPDGKDGAHRLSSTFTEWMMGLPAGWITDAGLSRNDELKACGNGVVPQQAELALRILLNGISFTPPQERQVNLPTPTVSDTYTDNLKSSQQKEGSMHSVTLPQAVRMVAE